MRDPSKSALRATASVAAALPALVLVLVACGRADPQEVATGDRPTATTIDERRAPQARPAEQRRTSRLQIETGDAVPDFAFTDVDGVERHLSDYRGKVVLLDFWGIWCKPCVAEVPHLVDTYERFRDRGFEIVGVNYRDDEETLRSFLDDNGMSWMQTREGRGANPIHELYSIRAWPSYYLIDESGNLLALNPRGKRLTEALEAHFGR